MASSAPELTHYISGFVCSCFSSLGPPSMSQGLCVLASVPWVCLPLSRGLVLTFPRIFSALPTVSWILECSSSYLPPLLLGGSCALERFEYHASLIPPSSQARPLHGASVVSWFPKPAVWLESQSKSCSWAEKCNFPCCLPSKSLLCPDF